LNILFPTYHTKSFETTILHLKNLTVILIDNINSAVEEGFAKKKSDNKTVQDYLKELEPLKSEP
jgi:hypothetical protein